MSRFTKNLTVENGSVRLNYGFDRPLSQYFLDLNGRVADLKPYLEALEKCAYLKHLHIYWEADDEDGQEDAWLHAVGPMSNNYGSKGRLLDAVKFIEAVAKMPVMDQCHKDRAAMDLPF